MNLRYRDSVKFECKVADVNEPYLIVPLILGTFLENAIKHGPDRYRKNAWIKVNLSIKDDILIYNIANSVNNFADKHPYGGIGLQNIKRRLDIYYKDRYSLDIIHEEGFYAVFLRIKL